LVDCRAKASGAGHVAGFEHFCGGDEGVEVVGGLLNQGQSVLEGLVRKIGDGALDRSLGESGGSVEFAALRAASIASAALPLESLPVTPRLYMVPRSDPSGVLRLLRAARDTGKSRGSGLR
jgi:hypothetical protein